MTATFNPPQRILMGSDFGFCWCPHGTYARELTHYVKLAGFKSMDALVAATHLLVPIQSYKA